MKLLVLGSGTLYPRANRASAGIAVFDGVDWHPFDLGRGVLQRMADLGLDPLALKTLHLSHLHPDHCCDLVPLLFGLNYGPPREDPLDLTAPPGFGDFFERLQGAWRWLAPRFPLRIRETAADRFPAGRLTVECRLLAHGEEPNLGFRIEGPAGSLAYTGDTGPCGELLSLASGVDILVSECSLPDDRAVETHMSPTPLGEAAQRLGCRTLVVTHLYPETDPAEAEACIRRRFEGEVVFAHDGLEREI